MNVLVVAIVALLAILVVEIEAGRKVVCYYGNWGAVENINPMLCTHIIYAFVQPDFNGNIVTTASDQELIPKFIALKKRNLNVKLLAAFGGANWAATSTFSALAANPSARSLFATNVFNWLKSTGFDGVDIDWEYPVISDKANFILLLSELRKKTPGMLLSVATNPAEYYSENAYDFPNLFPLVDFINVMTYDLHGAWESITGIHTNMFSDPLSVESCVNYWLGKGAPREKLIIGMAFYGKGFILADPNNHGIGAPRGEAIDVIVEYNQICLNKWQSVYDTAKKSNYAFSGNNWIGYDDANSIAIKCQYINDNNLGGGMIWHINQDDVFGKCQQGVSPLLNVISKALMGSAPITNTPAPITTIKATTVSQKVTTAAPAPTTQKITTPAPAPTTQKIVTTTKSGGVFTCSGKISGNLYKDPANCSKYYVCSNGIAYSMSCSSPLKFNPAVMNCDWTYNFIC